MLGKTSCLKLAFLVSVLVTSQFYNLFGELAAPKKLSQLKELRQAEHHPGLCMQPLPNLMFWDQSNIKAWKGTGAANALCLPSPLASTEDHALLSLLISIPQLANVCISIVQTHFPLMEGLMEVCALDPHPVHLLPWSRSQISSLLSVTAVCKQHTEGRTSLISKWGFYCHFPQRRPKFKALRHVSLVKQQESLL